jgi:hypothetical protein
MCLDPGPGARPDRIAIAGYLGTDDVFDQAIACFSEAYADQNQHDCEALHRLWPRPESRPKARTARFKETEA